MRVNPIAINASVNPRTILFAITCAAILSPVRLCRLHGVVRLRHQTRLRRTTLGGTSSRGPAGLAYSAGDGDGDMVAEIRGGQPL